MTHTPTRNEGGSPMFAKSYHSPEEMSPPVPARRRLSIFSNNTGGLGYEADGLVDHLDNPQSQFLEKPCGRGIVHESAFHTQVGIVPSNPNKVNQDSLVEIEGFANDPNKQFFAVMDGHGYRGREVSQLIRTHLPINLEDDEQLQTRPVQALVNCFKKTADDVARSKLDVSFSGSTCVSVLLVDKDLYCANLGDSRAVLGCVNEDNTWEAVSLSDDQKPDRPDEMTRILDCGGRVEAFKGQDGEDIGPKRVWLKHQDAPGLAMSRSFGKFGH
eukprot:Platyproteum_vivax@DN6710_c0_g1_i1.p1